MNPLEPLRRLRQPLVKGHPIHAILTDVPAGTLPVSLGLDLLSRLSGSDRFRTSALDTFALAWLASLATVAAGWWDYANVPAEHPARRPGLFHGLANSALLGLGTLNLALRLRERRGPVGGVPFLLSTLGFGGLLGAAWLGGHLVFRYGWRVEPAERLELMEKELERDGLTGYAERARAEVARYEREETLIP
jgi:uncharacterized membrane protein